MALPRAWARWLLAALGLAAALLAWAASARADAPGLRVEGNRLVRIADGSAFVVHGVNWPSFEYACAQGYAYSSDWDDAAIAAIASWRINAVRVPLNEDCWLGRDGANGLPGGSAAGYRAAVQRFVAALHVHGLVAILDLHWAAPDGTLALGQRAMPTARSPEFWSSVAAAFRDDRAVMFDAYNEPYSRFDGDVLTFGLSWTCWRDGGCAAPLQNDQTAPYDGTTYPAVGMQAIVNAIRGAGAPQPILLAGRDYANDLGEWLTHRPSGGAPGTADDQLVASFHNYPAQTCRTAACWDATIAPVAAQVPVVTTEIGQTDCGVDHLERYVAWADARGIGYAPWAWWVRADDPTCASYALIADAAGTPRAPVGTWYRAHLSAITTSPSSSPSGGGAGSTGPPPPPSPPPAPGASGRRAAGLRLLPPIVRGGVVSGSGRVAASVRGRVVIEVRHRLRGVRRVRVIVVRVPVARGRYRYRVRLPRRARLVSVTARFAGSARFLPGRAVRVSRP